MGTAVPLREIYLYLGFREIVLGIHRKYQTWIIQKNHIFRRGTALLCPLLHAIFLEPRQKTLPTVLSFCLAVGGTIIGEKCVGCIGIDDDFRFAAA